MGNLAMANTDSLASDDMSNARNLVAEARFSEAEQIYRPLADQQSYDALHNLGFVYRCMGRSAESERCYRRALEVAPTAQSTRFALAVLLLSQGRYAEGWPLYESRVRHLNLYEPKTAAQPWRGEDLSGKRLLVLGEQGFGDQIQFMRFIRQTHAESAVYWVHPNLCRLFVANGQAVAPGIPDMALPQADYWVRAMSLPLHLRVDLSDVCAQPYLSAKPRDGYFGRIGLVTRGRPTHENDANRSMPEDIAGQLVDRGSFVMLDPLSTGARDFMDTAEIVAALDLVITVDTSIAHLAGAMGKPVWVMLPAIGTDWRWLNERTDSPWYPTMKLYRQPKPGDWANVVDSIISDLRSVRPR